MRAPYASTEEHLRTSGLVATAVWRSRDADAPTRRQQLQEGLGSIVIAATGRAQRCTTKSG